MSLWRQVPAMNDLLKAATSLVDQYGLAETKRRLQKVLGEVRKEIRAGQVPNVSVETLVARAQQKEQSYHLRPVVNATGTVLHTNLGRSLFNKEAMAHLSACGSAYVNVEYDLTSGKRGLRYENVEAQLCRLTGAEAALVVNNNAAAVLLMLQSLVAGKEVIISRGELVEIGGSFRIPDVMAQSGAQLVEVGATNKTHLFDYEQAITEETGALLKVHQSNFRQVGFTEAVDVSQLSTLAKQAHLPLFVDLGSGLLLDMSRFGLPYEPTVKEVVAAGADVVCFSGDKLLAGPQAGILVGKKKYINAMKTSPLLRALRVDKMTLAALDYCLAAYEEGDEYAIAQLPTLEMLQRSPKQLKERSIALCQNIQALGYKAEVWSAESAVGGGAYPEHCLPTFVVAIKEVKAETLHKALRQAKTPIIGRIYKQALCFDPRSLQVGDEEKIIAALEAIKEEARTE